MRAKSARKHRGEGEQVVSGRQRLRGKQRVRGKHRGRGKQELENEGAREKQCAWGDYWKSAGGGGNMGQGQTMGQGSSMELEVNMGQGGNRMVGIGRARQEGKRGSGK